MPRIHVTKSTLVFLVVMAGTAHGGGQLLWAWDVVPSSVRDYSSYDSIVYVDPAYDAANGEPHGTVEQPYQSWDAIELTDHVAYVQKRGTTIPGTIDGDGDGILIGAYGTGQRPVLVGTSDRPVNISGTGTTVRDLEIKSGDCRPSRLAVLGGDSVVLYNNCLHGLSSENRPTFAIYATGNAWRLLNNEIHTTGSEAMFGGGRYYEIAHNNIYNVGLGAPPNPDGNGVDVFQFDCGADGLWFHHNTIDMRLLNRKFGMIAGCARWCDSDCNPEIRALYEHNYFIVSNGRPVLHMVGNPVIVRNNIFRHINGVASGNYTQTIYALEESRFEVYNNVFVNYTTIIRAGDHKVFNNVVYNSGGGGYAIEYSGTPTDIRNNIFAGSPDCLPWGHYTGAPATNNLFEYAPTQQEKGNDYIIGDPLFRDPDNDDFRLHYQSPAIDAGDPSFVEELTPLSIDEGVWRDMAGNPIPSSGVDCGPYQDHATLPAVRSDERSDFRSPAMPVYMRGDILTLSLVSPQVVGVEILNLLGKSNTLCDKRLLGKGNHKFFLNRRITGTPGTYIVRVRGNNWSHSVRFVKGGH